MLKYVLLLLFSFQVSAKQIHIAIIDSGLPSFSTNAKICKNGVIDVTETDVYDKIQHGSNILGIISDRLKDIDYCVYIVKIYTGLHQTNFMTYLKGIMVVYYLPSIDIVNISSNGSDVNNVERVLITGLLAMNIKIVTAAGNDHLDLDKGCNSYPACYMGVISVGNGISNNNRSKTSNFGRIIKQWRDGFHVYGNGVYMSGTSQSTAIYTSDLAKQIYYGSLNGNKTN